MEEKKIGRSDLYEGGEQYVFVSYCHRNREQVEPYLKKLAMDGYRLWYDKGIETGTKWRDNIARHLSGCHLFLPFVSKEFVESENCEAELNKALDDHKIIQPVNLDGTPLPPGAAMYLNGVQSVMAADYENFDGRYEALTASKELQQCQGTKIVRFGPSETRCSYTYNEKIPTPVFNAVTDHPERGDERRFVFFQRVGEDDRAKGPMRRVMCLREGDRVEVTVWFRNDADPALNSSLKNYVGYALRSRMAVTLPDTVSGNTIATLSAGLSAENTEPLSCSDSAELYSTSEQPLSVRYIPGSARLYAGEKAEGRAMGTGLFSGEGALIGSDELNGVVRAGDEYAGCVRFRIQAEQFETYGLTVTKTVSTGREEYAENTAAENGDRVGFHIEIHNGGKLDITNAVLREVPDEGLTVQPGSFRVESEDADDRDQLETEQLQTGFRIGTIKPGDTVTIVYMARVEDGFVEGGAVTYFSCDGCRTIRECGVTTSLAAERQRQQQRDREQEEQEEKRRAVERKKSLVDQIEALRRKQAEAKKPEPDAD